VAAARATSVKPKAKPSAIESRRAGMLVAISRMMPDNLEDILKSGTLRMDPEIASLLRDSVCFHFSNPNPDPTPNPSF
jgi:hypothetical protein